MNKLLIILMVICLFLNVVNAVEDTLASSILGDSASEVSQDYNNEFNSNQSEYLAKSILGEYKDDDLSGLSDLEKEFLVKSILGSDTKKVKNLYEGNLVEDDSSLSIFKTKMFWSIFVVILILVLIFVRLKYLKNK